jgi:hypothetical protein
MKCLECGKKIEPSGMCCNSEANSGYQCYCENCKIMWIDTFDGRILIDEFLTAIVRQRGKPTRTHPYKPLDTSQE